MNNDELKKKIADIIYHTGCTGACCECDYSKHSDADTYCKAMLKASALVAAGIGDVKEAETENAALRERLEKSVELPVNISDVKYIISSDKSCVLEEKVIAVQATKYEYNVEVDEIDTKNQYGTIEGFKIKQWNGDMFFKTREAAEARLAELKGEER